METSPVVDASVRTPTVTLWHGDCRDVMATLPDASVDAVVTDPPYELGFMGKGWDASGIAYDVAMWADCLRVLKPGGHLLAFGGSRTWHRLVCAVEDAGFEVRDSIAWVYASGFPKSLDVSKAIDKAAGAEREVVGDKLDRPGYHLVPGARSGEALGDGINGHTQAQRLAAAQITAPATPDAARWQGWGTALKPAFEPICVARKPLAGTVAATVLAHGTGALNIDGCRVGTDGGTKGAGRGPQSDVYGDGLNGAFGEPVPGLGRWPSNLVLTHAPDCGSGDGDDTTPCVDGCPVAELDAQSGVTRSPSGPVTQGKRRDGSGWDRPVNDRHDGLGIGYADSGGASRFFPTFRYQAKAPTKERPKVEIDGKGVAHPTVKPLALIRWLVRLVTPPGGTVLDLFGGSGTTGEAAALEGFDSVLVELTADYHPLIRQRLERVGVTGDRLVEREATPADVVDAPAERAVERDVEPAPEPPATPEPEPPVPPIPAPAPESAPESDGRVDLVALLALCDQLAARAS